MRILSLIVFVLGICSCSNEIPIENVRKKADLLLDKIAKGEASDEFPEEYFQPLQRELILYDLANKCDFMNRKGGFVNHHYKKGVGEKDLISIVYEFELVCGNIRFILTYQFSNSKEIKLFKFEMESKH